MRGYTGQSILANLFQGPEAVGGKLYFDEKGMTFKSHSFNIQTGQGRIEYAQIVGVHKSRTLGIVPNSIVVELSDGTAHKFVINRQRDVIEFLFSRITQQAQER